MKVGVVKEIKYYDLTAPPESQAYVPFAQWTRRDMNVIARTRGDAAMIAVLSARPKISVANRMK